MSAILETARLILRAPRLSDASAYAVGVGDYEVVRFLTSVPHPYTTEMARAWLAKAPKNTPERNLFTIECDGEVIGSISLINELGFWLARPHWGKGYMTEAARRLIAWHFAETTASQVRSSAHHDNSASLRVQMKLGFAEIGRAPRFSQALQRNIEHVETRLTRAAFQQGEPAR